MSLGCLMLLNWLNSLIKSAINSFLLEPRCGVSLWRPPLLSGCRDELYRSHRSQEYLQFRDLRRVLLRLLSGLLKSSYSVYLVAVQMRELCVAHLPERLSRSMQQLALELPVEAAPIFFGRCQDMVPAMRYCQANGRSRRWVQHVQEAAVSEVFPE